MLKTAGPTSPPPTLTYVRWLHRMLTSEVPSFPSAPVLQKSIVMRVKLANSHRAVADGSFLRQQKKKGTIHSKHNNLQKLEYLHQCLMILCKHRAPSESAWMVSSTHAHNI